MGQRRQRPCSARGVLIRTLSLSVGMVLLAAGCSGGSNDAKRSFHTTAFRASDFVDPRTHFNKWLPFKPGMQWFRDGTTLIGNRQVPNQVVTTATDVVREVNGVKTLLVYDHSIAAGQVVQESLDYFAVDKLGNLWIIGGATEQYEAGRFVEVQDAWMSGVADAKAGILMPADPTVHTPPWFISRHPGEGDAAEVVRTQKQECEPFACFPSVLVIREGKAAALDNEFKYYSLDVGQIRNEPRKKSRHEDTERLINVLKLTPEGLAEASAAALRIDRRAAAQWPQVFGKTKATRSSL